MTIKVFPSRLEGEPIETHQTKRVMSVSDWLTENVKGYTPDAPHQFTVTINGTRIEPDEFPLTQFGASDDVQIHVEAHGVDPLTALFYAAVLLLSVAIYMMMPKPGNTSNRQGRSMSEQGLAANTRRYGEPIREIAGSPVIFPDYLTPPFRYYKTFRQQWCETLLCVGKGSFLKSLASVKVGDTPALALGEDVEIVFYEPGADLSAETAAQWWHTPEEVGFTTQGNAGINLGATTEIERVWGSSFEFSGVTITSPSEVPEGWETGMDVRVEADHPVTFGTDWISSPMLDSLDIAASEEVELTGQNAGTYTVAAVVSGSGGVTGAAAEVTGSVTPARLDFGTTFGNLSITLRGTSYGIVLTTTVATVAELVNIMNAQLNSTPIRASEDAGIITFTQQEPYLGGNFTLGGDSLVDLMGTSQVYTAGVASSPANGTRYQLAGASFAAGEQVISVGRVGLLFTITTKDTNEITVEPPSVIGWTGFPSSVSPAESYVSLSSGSIEGGWQGWFMAVPAGEKAIAFQVDIFFPQGIIRYNSKGHARDVTVEGEIQWRIEGDPTIYNHEYSHTAATPDQVGITFGFVLNDPGRVEVRVRAKNPPSDDTKVNDKQQWAGLRAHIMNAPMSYEGVTTMAVRLRTGDQISGAAENKISLRAERILPTLADPEVMEPTRDIAPFFVHMLDTVGYGRDRIDMTQLEVLNSIWTSRKDTFDIAFETSGTLKTAANMCLNAGFAELTVQRGKVVPVRDALRPSFPTRVYTVGDYTKPLTESTEAIQPDDIDGVDADYVDYVTGKTKTVQYRLDGDIGRRVEKITVAGVTDELRAWRLAARRRRIAAYRRTTFTGGTELAAMNSHYWDHVGLQDGIPHYGQSAFAVAVSGSTVTVSEEIIPVDGQMIAVMRRQDGTATRAVAVTVTGGNQITFPNGLPTDVVLGDSGAERATMILFGSRELIYHQAIMTQVSPTADGKVDFTAVNYDPRVYADDDGGEKQRMLTSYEYIGTPETSMLYPYEFGDAMKTSQLLPRAWLSTWPIDTITTAQLAPEISVDSTTLYGEYRMAPERISTSQLAPTVSVETVVIYSTSRMAPEQYATTQLAPSIGVSTIVVVYRMIPERIETTQLAPQVTVA